MIHWYSVCYHEVMIAVLYVAMAKEFSLVSLVDIHALCVPMSNIVF